MKTFFKISLIFSTILLYSCEVPLNVDAPFRQRYVLNGIMRSDSSIQYITVTRSYRPVNDINPTSDTSDKSVIGATVNIWYKDTVYTLRDTSIVQKNSTNKNDSIHVYYVQNLKPDPGQNLAIEALLPNGLLLQSSSKLPDVSPFDFFDQTSDVIVPPVDGRDYIYVLWESLGQVIYQPRIMIDYYVKGSTELHQHQVPLVYVNQNGSSVPVYPSHTQTNYFRIDVATISAALNEIAQSEDDKSNYSISQIDVQLIVYDENLTTYYSSLQNSVDTFTVKVDPSDYSDIQGGYGIFGSFSRTDYYLRFNYKYLNDLGYK
jgi:hypothetical protein